MRIITIILSCMLSFCAGLLLFAIHYEWILFRLPATTKITTRSCTTKRTIAIEYWKSNSPCREYREIVWSTHPVQQAACIISNYLSLIESEGIITNHSTLQTVATDRATTTLICSLSHNPFDLESSTQQSLYIIEGLLSTIRAACPQFKQLILLINQHQLLHPHFDFSQPWPMTGFLSTSSSMPIPQSKKPSPSAEPIIMIHPSGDTHRVGRTIGDAFERTITTQLAHALKQEMGQIDNSIRVIISRTLGETGESLGLARIVHRIRPTIVIHLSAYYQSCTTPEIALCIFCLHPNTDSWSRKKSHSLLPYYYAHLTACTLNHYYATMLQQQLHNNHCPATIPHSTAFPYAPLIGVQYPAIALEIGIHEPSDILLLIPSLAQALVHSVTLRTVHP